MKINYNLKDIQDVNYSAIPPGYYMAIIRTLEFKKTKKAEADGTHYGYLNLKIEIIEGPFSGRILFKKLNVESENQKVQEWHRGLVKRIFNIIGKENPENYEEMCGAPIMVEVEVKAPDDYNKNRYNEIKDFLVRNDSLLAIKYQMPIYHQQTENKVPSQDELNDDIPF
jgi:uncharacterized protein DUF669